MHRVEQVATLENIQPPSVPCCWLAGFRGLVILEQDAVDCVRLGGKQTRGCIIGFLLFDIGSGVCRRGVLSWIVLFEGAEGGVAGFPIWRRAAVCIVLGRA